MMKKFNDQIVSLNLIKNIVEQKLFFLEIKNILYKIVIANL